MHYELLKKLEFYLPRGLRIKMRIEKEDRSKLPHWMYYLSDITGYEEEKPPLPKGYYYLEDLVEGKDV